MDEENYGEKEQMENERIVRHQSDTLSKTLIYAFAHVSGEFKVNRNGAEKSFFTEFLADQVKEVSA